MLPPNCIQMLTENFPHHGSLVSHISRNKIIVTNNYTTALPPQQILNHFLSFLQQLFRTSHQTSYQKCYSQLCHFGSNIPKQSMPSTILSFSSLHEEPFTHLPFPSQLIFTALNLNVIIVQLTLWLYSQPS